MKMINYQIFGSASSQDIDIMLNVKDWHLLSINDLHFFIKEQNHKLKKDFLNDKMLNYKFFETK